MNEEQFGDLWMRLVKAKHAVPAQPLTRQEQLFYAANSLRGCVPRSGFVAYFENSSGDEVRDAYEALRIMQLDDVLALLERAQQIVLRDQLLPEGDGEIVVLSLDVNEDAYWVEMDKLDIAVDDVQESFYECDEKFFDALCWFAERNGLT